MVARFNSSQTQVLVVLTRDNVVNYIGGQIIFPLFRLIKADFELSAARLGLRGTVVRSLHSRGRLPLGLLAGRSARKKVISVLPSSRGDLSQDSATLLRALLQMRAVLNLCKFDST